MKLEDIEHGFFNDVVFVGQGPKIEHSYITSMGPFIDLGVIADVIKELELTYQNGICVYFARMAKAYEISPANFYLYRDGEVEEITMAQFVLPCGVYNGEQRTICESNPIPLDQIPLSELDIRMRTLGYENRHVGIMRSTLRKLGIAENSNHQEK